jgi:hypothetical protein
LGDGIAVFGRTFGFFERTGGFGGARPRPAAKGVSPTASGLIMSSPGFRASEVGRRVEAGEIAQCGGRRFRTGYRPGPGWLDPVSNGIIADDVLLAFIYL